MSTYPFRSSPPRSRLARLSAGLSLLLAITLLAAFLPARALAAPLQAKLDCKSTYEVKRGDSLNSIGKKYGRAVNQIVAANDWDRPYTIYVGQRICVPTKSQTDVPKVEARFGSALAVYFTVGRDEDELLVYTYNYPKTTVLVKVDDAGDSVKKLYDVDEINIAAVGNGKAWRFKLPPAVRDASKLFVCLKDKTTNYLQCVTPRSGP
jgi:hypothetical protein